MTKSRFSILVMFLAAAACRQSDSSLEENYKRTQIVLEKHDYIKWFEGKETTLNKVKEIDEITYSLKYKPAEFIACTEENIDKVNTGSIEKKISELDGLDYYDFKIQITSGVGELLKYQVRSPSDYDNRVNYFAFGMEKDIKLVEGNDTLKCVLFHFERAYDIIPYATFLLAFPKSKSVISEKTFIYNDRVFKKGLIKITYTPEELSQIPKLKTI